MLVWIYLAHLNAFDCCPLGVPACLCKRHLQHLTTHQHKPLWVRAQHQYHSQTLFANATARLIADMPATL